MEFHERVRQAFLDLAAADPDHYLVLDARRPVDEIAAAVREPASQPLLGRPGERADDRLGRPGRPAPRDRGAARPRPAATA